MLGALLFANRLSGTLAVSDRRDDLGVSGNTSKMKYLILSNNKFSGTLSPSLCELSALRGIAGNNQQLSGTFPKCLGALEHISVVAFTRNYLAGRLEFDSIPASKLGTVIMSSNLFSCTEPALESAAGLAAGAFEGVLYPSLLGVQQATYEAAGINPFSIEDLTLAVPKVQNVALVFTGSVLCMPRFHHVDIDLLLHRE